MRLATAACMQKYGNVSFVTVACAKCMRYGGGVGDHTIGGGGGVGIRDPDSYISHPGGKTREIHFASSHTEKFENTGDKLISPLMMGILIMCI